jgi:hypothetical protein
VCSSDLFITVGTKNVIKSLPSEPKTEGNQVPTGDLINPTKKADLMRERNIQIQDDEETDDFIDLNEIL